MLLYKVVIIFLIMGVALLKLISSPIVIFSFKGEIEQIR